MKKVSKKKTGAVVISVILSVVLGSICAISMANTSQESTGLSQKSIEDYEKNGITTYIGHGYNIVEKNYINAADVQKNYIFNIQNAYEHNIRDTKVAIDEGTTAIKTYNIHSTQASDFIKDCLTQLSGGIGINTNWCGFTQIKPSASFAYVSTSTKKANNEYIKHVRQMDTSYVNWMLEEKDYYKYLTETFKKDVMQLEPTELFNKYGTHVLTGVKMGGKVEVTYQMSSYNLDDLKEAVAQVSIDIAGIFNTNNTEEKPSSTPSVGPTDTTNQDVNKKEATGDSKNKEDTDKKEEKDPKDKIPDVEINDITKDKTIGFTHNNTQTTTINNVLTTIHTSCYGGNGHDMSTLKKMEEIFPQWIKNVPEAPALVGVLGNDSLYPVWKLVKCIADNDDTISEEVAEARMKELEAAFNKYGKDNYDAIIAEELGQNSNKKQVVELDVDTVGVKAGTNYDKEKKLSNARQALHDGFDLGKILVVNAEKRENNTYKYNEEKGLQIRYRLEQNISKLPIGNTKSYTHKVVENPQVSGQVAGYGNVFGNHYIKGLGKGCYFTQVTFNDQSTETIKGINFLPGMNKNETITLLDTTNMSVMNHDGIDKINIFVTYRTVAVNMWTTPVQDWVVETELDFE